jgi:DNA-binding response OmpR family regulator
VRDGVALKLVRSACRAHIAGLHARLERDRAARRHLRIVRGVGYQ